MELGRDPETRIALLFLFSYRCAMDKFQIYLIKPTRYDDDGYPLQWWRSLVPSNSLACVSGIVHDAIARGALAGEDVDIHVIDEIHSHVSPKRILRDIARHGGRGFIGLVGVQTNQFPRAMDLARDLPRRRAAGVHRRLPRLRLPVDAQGDAARTGRGAGARHQLLRRRGRGRRGWTRCCAMPPPARSSRSTII